MGNADLNWPLITLIKSSRWPDDFSVDSFGKWKKSFKNLNNHQNILKIFSFTRSNYVYNESIK